MPEYIYEVSEAGSTFKRKEEVIRCKDCVWYGIAELKSDGTADKRYKPSWCYFWKDELKEHGYCSMADRREHD